MLTELGINKDKKAPTRALSSARDARMIGEAVSCRLAKSGSLRTGASARTGTAWG